MGFFRILRNPNPYEYAMLSDLVGEKHKLMTKCNGSRDLSKTLMERLRELTTGSHDSSSHNLASTAVF